MVGNGELRGAPTCYTSSLAAPPSKATPPTRNLPHTPSSTMMADSLLPPLIFPSKGTASERSMTNLTTVSRVQARVRIRGLPKLTS